MYRRQQFDRLNPRNVLPSRHTLFIRGLPGTTDVAKVKDFFCNETNSRCSVEFFSTSEDKKRFSVAIRFKSHEIASEMLRRHNGKTMFGYPVELTWFKDLKKARAKMYEERRQVRRFPPNQRGFRGPEKGIASPGNYGDARRIRTGSSSSGGRGYRNNNRNRRSMDRRSVDRRSLDRRSIDRRSTERRSTDRRSTEQRSVSRSRSFTGSSSRSASNSGRSQSRSVSRTRHSLPSNPGDSMHASESEFNGRMYDDRRASRNLSRHSRDRSSSSSRSSVERKRQDSSIRQSSNRNNTQYDQSADENSSPDYHARRNQQLSRSPSINEQNLAFSNAPAPNAEGGSSLGFEQSPAHGGNFSRTRHSSENSSSNASVASSSGAFDSPRNRSARKRMHSISPPYNDRSRNTKAKTEAATYNDEKSQPTIEPQKRRKTKNTHSPANNSTESLREPPHTRSKTQRTSLQKTPVSENSTTIRQANASRKHRSSAVKGNQKSSVKDTSPTVEKNTSKNSHDSRRSDATRSPLSLTSHSTKRWRTPEDDVNDDHLRKEEKWPSANSKSSKLKQKSLVSSANNSSDNDHSDTSKVDGNQVTVSRNSNGKEKESLKPMPKKSNHSSNNNNRSNAVVSAPAVTNEVNESGDFSDDVINLIRDHKNALAEDYKRDCEAFTTVVRMLISKDQDLESRLMPMLKEILHERGQRCIEDLRAFISDHQANESSTNESIEKNHVD
ncbi:Periphilin-1 [Schistosoma japonicum]|uniref:Periphilin-1 n=2 Tax=Schistosoma japonicum TaxID=6182 RepID=A0A4Z2DLZ0_SCHJA|nr:Periphilin-1 [Schistosoma japonicum]